MAKKLLLAYTIFATSFLLFLFAFFGYCVQTTRIRNSEAVVASFQVLRDRLERYYVRHQVFDTKDFAELINGVFLTTTDLRLLTVYSLDSGIEYLRARDGDSVVAPISDIATPRGIPLLRYNSFTETRITSSIARPHAKSMIVEVIYRIFDGDDLFPLLRDGLLVLGVFIFLSILVLVVADGVDRRSSSDTASRPRTTRPPVTENGLEKRLTLELERASYNEQDCSFALVKFTGIPAVDTRLGRSELSKKLAFEDLVFDQGEGLFAAILVNTDLDQALKAITDFSMKLDADSRVRLGDLRAGATSRNGRLVEGSRLLVEARQALRRTSAAEPVVGFKPDPGKYRQFLSRTAVRSA